MKSHINIIIIITLLIISYKMIINSNIVLESVLTAFEIWKNNIFPSIFPFFIISSLLINYGFINLIGNILKPLMFLFGINKNVSFIFILSIFTGFPSSAKYIKDLYSKDIIDLDTSSKALMFTHFSNPLFIINTVSNLLNTKYAYIILFTHYISNIIIGLIFKNYKNTYYTNNKTYQNNIKNNIGTTLSIAIKDGINTVLLILGTITTFSFLTSIINQTFNLNSFFNALISSILEITNGIHKISLLKISIRFKAALISSILSFGGFAIHSQIYSIISDTKIKYIPYLIARIIHMIIAFILTLLITI